jgi:hypothetical protein
MYQMLMVFEPSQQLMAALFVGTATVSAAVVNAMAQVKVAREARRNSKPAPPASRRVKLWVLAGAAVALGLGWSATGAQQSAQAADGSGRPNFIGAGVAAVIGPRDARSGQAQGTDGALTLALLRLSQPMSEQQVVSLLQTYDLRAYAIDLRLVGASEAWRPVPVAIAPAEALPRARGEAVRHATMAACALEAITLTASDTTTASQQSARDTAALRIVRERAENARRHAQRLASDSAVIHAVRVLGSAASASRAAQDAAVARAELMRYDDWTVPAAELDGHACEPESRASE